MVNLAIDKESIPGDDLNNILLSFPECFIDNENIADSYFSNTIKTLKQNEKIVNLLHRTVSDIKITLIDISNIEVD